MAHSWKVQTKIPRVKFTLASSIVCVSFWPSLFCVKLWWCIWTLCLWLRLSLVYELGQICWKIHSHVSTMKSQLLCFHQSDWQCGDTTAAYWIYMDSGFDPCWKWVSGSVWNLFTYHHAILTTQILDHLMLVNRLGDMNDRIYINHINFSCAGEKNMSFCL